MNPEIEMKLEQMKAKYEDLLNVVGELYAAYYGKEIEHTTSSIEEALKQLKDDEKITDYIYGNVLAVIEKYQHQETRMDEYEAYLDQLSDYLTMVIVDVSNELIDVRKASLEHDRERLVNWLNN